MELFRTMASNNSKDIGKSPSLVRKETSRLDAEIGKAVKTQESASLTDDNPFLAEGLTSPRDTHPVSCLKCYRMTITSVDLMRADAI